MAVLRIVAAIAVIVVWTGAYGKALLVPGTPSPPAELSGIMLAAVTWLFAGAARQASGTGERSATKHLREVIGRWLMGKPDGDE